MFGAPRGRTGPSGRIRSSQGQEENWRRRGPHSERGGDDSGRWTRAQNCVTLTWRHLLNVINENDPNKLVIALLSKSGWKLLLESDFFLDELRTIFKGLRKCCAAQSPNLLRSFLSETLVGSRKFVTRCCFLFPTLKQEDLELIEDIFSVLECSACLQPAGLSAPCMVLLRSLEGHPMVKEWDERSDMDIPEKIKTIGEQLKLVTNERTAAQGSASRPRFFKGYRISNKVPNNFREMEIFPTQADLDEKTPFLRSNIVGGAYENLEHYLDVQFRLLREDFVSPLRNGLREFRSLEGFVSPRRLRAIQDVRFYLGVSSLKSTESKPVFGVGNVVNLALAADDFKRVNWERSKRFINGSLVGISADNFETIIFSTVRYRDSDKLKLEGLLTLELCLEDDWLKFKQGVPLSLIESSSAYFEAYRYNLAALQSMTEMPLSRYLVLAEKSMEIPTYMLGTEDIDLAPIMKAPSETTKFPVDKWPPAESTLLNDRQFEAVRSAFSNELCVIQGPPGTGKTFVGLKIVQLMLLNEVTERPILVVCYTNHALDQFLEGISEFTDNIVRIGGRCESGALEKFTLRNHRRSFRQRRSADADPEPDLRHEIQVKQRAKKNNEALKEKVELWIARFEGRAIFERCNRFSIEWSKELRVSEIGLDSMGDSRENDQDDLEDDGHLSDEDRGQLESDDLVLEMNCNSKREKAIQSRLGTYRQYDVARKDFRLSSALTYAKYRLQQWLLLRREIESGEFPSAELPVPDWWLLYREEHWKQVYEEAADYLRISNHLNAVDTIYLSEDNFRDLKDPGLHNVEQSLKCLKFRLEEIHTRLRQIMGEIGELENALDSEIIKVSEIIGITTTGAAKYNELLRNVGYEIVVVEEAAEVLEAHLVTCLSPTTKQMVLIGDHQQLQPNTTVYKLATNFNLQVSLFERLILNGIPHVRLQEQHRMRDEFLKLLVPTIYNDFFSHESVFKYEDIRGLSHNLFFVTHEFAEDNEKENSSKSNSFEAEFVARLALYLRMQNYAPKQIVILTTYSGQVISIRNEIHSLDNELGWTGMKNEVHRDGSRTRVPVRPGLPVSMFEGIRITTVDNYQGEESDIVIASFVRSNEDQKIGFLSRDNRVCVALSRAKKGFYCVGNLAMLAQASQTWRCISEVLLKGNYVNKGLELKCDVHDVRLLATKGSDFDRFLEGGCYEPCGARLDCGHGCPKACHRLDSTHEELKCFQKCERRQPCGHDCPKRCSEFCGDCAVNVKKTLACGHDADTRCSTLIEDISCRKPCEKRMPCGVHPCKKKCHRDCGKCMEIVEVDASCGHKVRIVCRDSENQKLVQLACDTKVEVELLCGHVNMLECREKSAGTLNSNLCEQVTEVTCSLGHKFALKCPIAKTQKVDEHCSVSSAVRIGCGHEIERPCCQIPKLDLEGLSNECRELVHVKLACDHEIQVPCRDRKNESNKTWCQGLVEEVLECGHPLSRMCNEPRSCQFEVRRASPCGHEVVTVCSSSCAEGDLLKLCTMRCAKVLACGHQCYGTCSSCTDVFHQPCLNKCGKTSFCGHLCTLDCHGQCSPCLDEEPASCPHSTKKRPCFSLINEPCAREPCHCPHLEAPCGAMSCSDCHCSCGEPCKKSLSCGKTKSGKYKAEKGTHSCVGLCLELCVCRVCHAKKMSEATLPEGMNRKDARFIRLPCNDIFEVNWLDAFMLEHKELLSFPKCPRRECGYQIRLLRRYHRMLERIRANMLEVYTIVFGDRNEMIANHEELFKQSQTNPKTRGNMEFVKKLIRLSETPSLFKLNYMRKFYEILPDVTPETIGYANKLIETDECQLQLLSDCLASINRARVPQLGARSAAIPIEEPLPVDQWAICEIHRAFSKKDNEECPKCVPDVETLVEDFAKL